MLGLGPLELIVILVLIVIFVGGKKLPQVGENLGRGISEFKRAIRGDSRNSKAVDTRTARTESARPSSPNEPERTGGGRSEE